MLRLIGLALLALPLLPLASLFGTFPDSGRLTTPSDWLLGSAIFLTVGWLVALVGAPERLERRLRGATARWGRRLPALGLVILACFLAAASWSLFRYGPLLVDSMVQLFQARIFASGHLTAALPPAPGAFVVQNMLLDGGRWYGQYPPGHSALLLPGIVAGAPWLVPVILSLVGAVAIYRFTSLVYDRSTARLALLLVALCPFFWFMGASFMSHVSSLCFVALFLWGFAAWEDGAGMPAALAGGLALGVAFLSRPYTAVAVAIPFGVFVAASAWRRREKAVGALLGAAMFIAIGLVYLAYNRATTGAALLPGYLKLWGPSHGPGFHVTPWGVVHTPLTGLRNELTDLQLLASRLFEWPLPALWPLGGALAAGWLSGRWDRRLVLAFLAVPAAYLFYWHRDSYLGPRFLYVTLAFLLPLTARALVQGYRRLAGVGLQVGSLFRPVDGARLMSTVAVLCFAWALAAGVPTRWRTYLNEYGRVQEHLPAEARKAGIDRGLVFVKVSAGNRLLASLRGLGASAPVVERAYRSVDFCELLGVKDAAKEEGWSAARIDRELEALGSRNEDLVRAPGLNGDASLRLRADRLEPGLSLPPSCAAELRYDGRGDYGIYTPHLLDNRPDLRGPLVVARDLRSANARLRAAFPDRPAFLYVDGRFEPLAH